jgi:4a-hydroxytetrahydrobiopterin dehydratase
MSNMPIKEIEERLKDLPSWEMVGSEITKTFDFPSFSQAVSFVNSIAEEAERMNHHPDMTIKYFTVKINLTTHSENGLTNKDFKLAKIIEQLV